MVVLPTAYLPTVQYFTILARNSKVLIEACETFPKQTCRNRCTIYSSNGKLDLVIPVNKPDGNHTQTKKILVCYDENWQINHWRAIESAYNSSPFFMFYRDDFNEIMLNGKFEKLIDINHSLITLVNDLIGIESDIKHTTEFRKSYEHDYRNEINNINNEIKYPVFRQVFNHKFGFIPNLSIIDLLFNLGPETKEYLHKISF